MFSFLALALAGCVPVDSVTILHTNDWHSHLQGQAPNAEYTPGTTGDDLTRGGAARVAAEVAALREAATDPVLVFDAGDWMDGTLFQLLRTDQAAELQVLDAIGYDAVTIGNPAIRYPSRRSRAGTRQRPQTAGRGGVSSVIGDRPVVP